MKHREERRRFWSALVARFEGSGRSRREFAAESGVGLAIFQYWLYKLRREHQAVGARKARVAEVRLVPVTVRARALGPVRLELRVAGVRMRVPVGADAEYVARLAAALREARAC
jgi:transposase